MNDQAKMELTVVSVCTLKDIEIWKWTAPLILKNICANRYVLYVPAQHVVAFRNHTPASVMVLDENEILPSTLSQELRHLLRKYNNEQRIGWYIQQFIKLSALHYWGQKGDVLLWDADTIPLRPIQFIDSQDRVALYSSNEWHIPYFDSIERSLGLKKIFERSFIAQCCYMRKNWISDFFDIIGNRGYREWWRTLVESIDFSQSSGFSEYETLGTFVMSTYTRSVYSTRRGWIRRGGAIFGSPKSLQVLQAGLKYFPLDYASFEQWDTRDKIMKVALNHLKLRARRSKNYLKNLFGKEIGNNGINIFLSDFFAQQGEKLIVQIGANDGIQNDFLRPYISQKGDYRCILIEPIPFYVEKLRQLYGDRPDVEILNCAVGEHKSFTKLFYIPPDIADQMHGDGPANNWAHGQGSFNKETIVHWINKNAFRGKEYKSAIPRFIASIASIDVAIMPASEVVPQTKNTLYIIDVQGAELEVLKGIDWKNAPKHIIIEDDVGNTVKLKGYLMEKGYKYICGDTDKLFTLQNSRLIYAN